MYFAARAGVAIRIASPQPDPRMLIYLLSRGRSLYSTQGLVSAAEKAGHEAEVIDPLTINVVIAEGLLEFYLYGEPLDLPDLVIGRFSPVFTQLGSALLSQFAAAGARVTPAPQALLVARDKWRAQTALTDYGVATPAAAMVHDLDGLPFAIDRLGGHPVIIKLLESTQGAGVMLSREMQTTLSVLQSFGSLHQGVLIQEYVPDSGGADLRVIVCGGEIVASMERIPAVGEFRSNLHRGGRAVRAELTAAERTAALDAAAAVGLDVAGVDMLRSRRGPLVMEVNASPGLEGIEAASGVDVAGAIIAQLLPAQ